MNEFFSKIDNKTLQTSGAIVMALFCVYVLYAVLTNDLSHLNSSINRQADIQERTNEVLIKNAEAISGNTEVLKALNQRIK